MEIKFRKTTRIPFYFCFQFKCFTLEGHDKKALITINQSVMLIKPYHEIQRECRRRKPDNVHKKSGCSRTLISIKITRSLELEMKFSENLTTEKFVIQQKYCVGPDVKVPKLHSI